MNACMTSLDRVFSIAVIWAAPILLALAGSAPAQDQPRGLVPPAIEAVAGRFLLWDPVPPNQTYEALAPAAERRVALNDAETGFSEPLVRLEVNYLGNGDIETRFLDSRYFVTDDAVHNAGNLIFAVDAYSQTAVIEQAYTLLPDGRRIEVDPASIQVVPDSEDTIFSDVFRAVVPFAALEEGAIAVLVGRVERRTQDWPLPTSSIIFPQAWVPRNRFELQVTWAEDREPPVLKSDFDGLECDASGPHRLTCAASNLPAYPSDPQVSYFDKLPAITLAEEASWADLSLQALGLVNDAAEMAWGLEAELADLLDGAESDAERLDRIHQFVAQKIRYLGLEHGQGGVVPRPAAVTLERRFGDCKDKTTLFVALARRAGLDAFPVLTSFKRFDPDKLILPALSYFDHMVACTTVADGGERCVDLTDPYSSYRSLSAPLQGAVRLDLRPGVTGPSRFAMPTFTWEVSVRTEISLRDDGTIGERQERSYRDSYGASLRGGLSSLSRDERRRWAVSQYQDYVSDMVEPEFDFSGLRTVHDPLVIRSTTSYPKAFDAEQLELYREPQSWLLYEVQTSQLANKYHAARFPGLNYAEETVFILPKGRQIGHKGATVDFESPYGRFQRRPELIEGGLRFRTELTIPGGEIPLKELKRFNRFLGRVQGQAELRFGLLPK